MNHSENYDLTIRQNNQKIISQDKECQSLIHEMETVEKLLSEFGFLTFGRDYSLCKNRHFSLQMISTSVELTIGNIISCCQSGCLADANTLLRKYRDDLFFYLYIVVYDTSNKSESDKIKIDEMEKNIDHWINNNLSNLNISTVLKDIGQSSNIIEAVKKYKLQSYFDKIGTRLNNYVHSNGISYYNRNINVYEENDLQKQMSALLNDMRFITVTFLFLLTLCSPGLIMSTDYIDHLECNSIPPKGSEYWVAPFITDYLRNNLNMIDKNCIDYLKDNTSMELE